MARVFDVVEYPNEMEDEIVHRFPEVGPGDFRIGSQVIVRESQAAVFFRDGNALDVFSPGRHTITTANIPLLIDLVGKLSTIRHPSLRKFISSRCVSSRTRNGVHPNRSSSATRTWAWALLCCRDLAPTASR